MAALDFPDTPINGQVFDKWTWNGTQWVLTANASATPRGIVSVGSFLSITSIPLPNDLTTPTTNNMSVPTVVGRKYRVNYQARAVGTNAVVIYVWCYLRTDGNNVSSAAPLITVPANSFNAVHYSWIFNGNGNAVVCDVALRPSDAASVVYTEPQISFFYAEDIGTAI